MDRIVMNSESLQKHFPEVYRDFFARNDLVVSGEFVLPWTREAWNDSKNYLRFKTSLPLKCYVWIKIRNDFKISFNWVSFFDISSKKFEKLDYVKVNKEENEIIKVLKKEFEKLEIKNWIEIEILSETTRWHWLWFSWVSAAIISYWIYKIAWIVNENNLFEENIFNKVFSLAWKMDFISRYWDTFWHNSIFTLKPNKWISYFFTDNVDIKLDTLDKLDNLFYQFKHIDNNNLDLPFDYFLVFSWMATDTKQVEYYKKLEYLDSETHDFVKENIFHSGNDIYLNKFSDKNIVHDAKLDMISIQNLDLLNLFHKIYKKAHDDTLISQFIEQLNTCRWVVWLLEKQGSFADDFLHLFKKNKSNYNEIVWVCPVYSWKLWGWYIVATKLWLSRETIDKTINDLKNIYPNVEIEYCSYLDGFSWDGVKVEQFISDGIYSKYVDKNKVIYKDNKWNNLLWDYNDILKNHSEGLLFDMIENKIYFNGEKLTSKDIPSQNTTIEVVSKLLENIWEEISNKSLPISSYTWNKNEMLGKIILPLLKFIEAKTGEKLQIVCKWSITDFFIKMWEVNLSIWTIRKI